MILKSNEEKQSKGSSAWTPAFSLVFGLNEALKMLEEEGFSNVFERHAQASNYIRNELKKLSFNTIADSVPPPGVTGAFTPKQISPVELRKTLLEKYSIRIAGGQNQWKDDVIRVGHMGSFEMSDLKRLIEAIIEIV